MQDQGLTIEWVSRKTGLAPLTVRSFLAGERQPGVRTCKLIAQALSLDEGKLLSAAGYSPKAGQRIVVDLSQDLAERIARLERIVESLDIRAS